MFDHEFNRTFSRFFPTPAFLSTPAFGVDISDESLKYVELIPGKRGIKIGRHGEQKIPPGIVEAGNIKNTKQMEGILLSLCKQSGLKSVRVSIPEQQIYLFKLRLEKAGLKSIREAIELMLEENIPIPATDAIFDYEILSQDSKSLDIQVTAIQRTVIGNYLEVFKNAFISVHSFELEAQAIAQAVIKEGDPDTYMIVDFGEKRTGIFIVVDGTVMFTSTLDLGGVMLNHMIEKNFKVSFEEAEKMKRQYGLQRNVDNKEVFPVILNSVSILRDEIAKHFLYWQTHKDKDGRSNPPIKKIILCGGDSNLVGLSDYFSVSMKTPVEMANVWVNIMNTTQNIPEIKFKQALSFAASIGLALGNFTKFS